MIRTLVFVGPHGSGKSTLCKAVAGALGWTFDDEIGERLRREALRIDPRAHAERPQEDFDARVFREEMARDALAPVPRVVETWHPGNAAFAISRNSCFDGAALSKARDAALAAPGVLVQPLSIGLEAARARRSEPGPEGIEEWFIMVGSTAARLARDWGLAVAPPIWTDRNSVDAAVRLVLQRFGK